MDKFNFFELLSLLESIKIDFDSLTYESTDGKIVDRHGTVINDSDVNRQILSDYCYDRISAYIKLLNEVLKFRPLPF